ncbi:S-adenosyl-L-methionine-dependent methyltransferase [Dentipellis sp. KUC8613]|nr:S-adenosyl-L-methionine-dependent methyltransferase [Dentipellis sp. KUC8613]
MSSPLVADDVLDIDADMAAMLPPAETAGAQGHGHHDHGHGHGHGHHEGHGHGDHEGHAHGHHGGHNHGHAHEHGHGHGHGTLADSNKDHFSTIAEKYSEFPSAIKLARYLAAAMRKTYAFNEESTTLLDFACGPGLVSRELAAYTKKIVGVDISHGMVDQYNKRVNEQGIPPEEMHAVCIELKGEPGELDGAKFDVIVCSMAYHHLEDIAASTRTLVGFLKPGGHLMVCDIARAADEREIIPEEFHKVVSHSHGISEAEIRGTFEGAGLKEFAFKALVKAKVHGAQVDLFVAEGVMAAE